MRRITQAAILSLLAATSGTAWPAAARQAPGAQAAEGLDAAKVSSRADQWLTAFEKAGDFSGVVLLAQGDRVLFEKAYGFADIQVRSPNRPETRFRVASLSKTFTAAAIEQLVNQGKLRYSDPLGRYVAGIPHGDQITIEQLLTHQSGIGVLDSEEVYRDCIAHQDLLQRLAAVKPAFAPGKESAYSNEGYFLLTAVIERSSGMPYEAFLQQNLFAALQMENSGVACRDLPAGRNAFGSVATASQARLRPLPYNEAALDGAGSVYSNAQDLLRWLRAVDSSSLFGFAKLAYPYGWGKRKHGTRELLEESGELEGFISHVAIYPREHIYAIVLGNIQSGFSQRIAQDLEAVFFGGQTSTPPAVSAILLGQRSMRQYAGTYHSKEIAYPQTLAIRDGELAMRWGQDPFWRELAMTDGDTFFLRADYARIRFERGADGTVHRMVWNWPGGAHLAFDKDRIVEDNVSDAPVNP